MKTTKRTELKHTEIGFLPSDWGTAKFRTILSSNIRHGIYKSKEFTNLGGVRLLKLGDVNSNDRINDQNMERVLASADELERFRIKEGNLVFARTSMMTGGLGNCSIVTKHNDPIIFDGNLLCAEIDTKIAEPEFYLYYFQSRRGQEEIARMTTGTQSRNIPGSNLMEVNIPILSKHEQIQVAWILSCLDSKIDLNRKSSETLEAMSRAVFSHWFIDFEFPNKEGNPYKSSGGEMIYNDELRREIPKGWKVGKTIDLCSSITNGGTPRTMESGYWNGDIAWFKTGELKEGPLIDSEEHITEEGLRNSACKLWEINTILIALYASPTVGRLGILKVRGASNQACSGLVAKREIGYPFLFYTLLFKRNEFNNLAVGAAQQNINQDVVKHTVVVIPDNQVLSKFNTLAESFLDKRTALLVESVGLSRLRDSLLPRLMTGKIRVPVEVR